MRIKVTSNIKKFERAFQGQVETALRKYTDAVVKSFLLSAFELILDGTPVDTGALLLNWKVYKHGGLRRDIVSSPYRRHDRYDMEGRMATKRALLPKQMELLKHELLSLNTELFTEGRYQTTIGLQNPTPVYAEMLDKGQYVAFPPYVNLTPDGFSVQAPQGIINVSVKKIQSGANNEYFSQFIGIGGN